MRRALHGSPVYAQLTRITGDPKYLKFMNAEFYATTSKLYDTEERLFYRDASFMDMREPNGRKVFWSRGNGWVYAGLAILLETVPENDPSYDFYRRLFLEMTDALLACQDENGSWRPSLLVRRSIRRPRTADRHSSPTAWHGASTTES